MLGPGRYLLGAAEISFMVGFAWLGAAGVRRRIATELGGMTANLATAVMRLAILLWAAELLGTFSLFKPLPYLLLVAGVGVGAQTISRGWRGGRWSPIAQDAGRAVPQVPFRAPTDRHVRAPEHM